MAEYFIDDKYIKAGCPTTPCEVLRELAADEIDNVRRRVAENQRVPMDVLLILATDENADVRIAVAENPISPMELLEQLIADESVDVRYSLAENPNLPIEILEKLSEDGNPYVSFRAQRTMRILTPSDITEFKPRSYADDSSAEYRAN